MTNSYDAIIIGAGQAGPSLAGRLDAAGMKVALIERKYYGGTCVNTGCMPTKTMVASARAAYIARRAADFGVMIGGGIGIDMKIVKARKDKVALTARANVERWLKGMKGCTLYEGHARFRAAHEIEVGGEVLAAERIFINVGGRAAIPDMPGARSVPLLTNTSMLELDTLPRHLVVVGGSYIGLEFAQMYRRFGCDVTVVERQSRLVSREDEDVSAAIKEILEAEGVKLRLNANCIHFTPRGADIGVGVDCTEGAPEERGSHVLMAVGRRPNTDDLGLDKAGVAVDAHGHVSVDDELRTNVPGIWAMGDCNGRGAFTHTAYNDFEIVAANLLDNDPRRVSDRFPCYALYIDPPLGRVGMTEAEARKTGRKIRIGRRPMTRVGRAVEKAETQGFMKIIVDAESEAIIGASILGTEGDEAIHGIIDMMYAKASFRTLQRAVHIHPTVSELIPTMVGDLGPAS
jgi:pyruvate/2-oxoglutarate dehydrogenase complex dihydrolipoamide dehydrogenase (E3) component